MWDPFGSLVRQLDTDFDNLVRRSFGAGGQGAGFVPSANVMRDGDDVVITLELPGIDPENTSVEVSDGRLLVTGERTEEDTRDENGVLIREIRAGMFRREFALPEHVTPDDIEADYDRGMLKIRVRGISKPKSEPRRISVRSHAGESTPATVEGQTQEAQNQEARNQEAQNQAQAQESQPQQS
jgi:HSP20 family protein